MARNKHLINVHTGTGTEAPSGASLYLGEIAVQHTPNEPALWIKMGTSNESEVYEKFIGETEIVDLIANSEILLGDGYTYTGIPYVTSATNIADAYSALTKEVLNDEYVISRAINDLNDRVEEISGNTGGGGGTDVGPLSAAVISLSAGVKDNEYVAAAAINYLNDKITELSGNSGGGADVSPLSAAVVSLSAAVVTVSANTGGGGGADIQPLSSATYSHVTNSTIHVTSSDKTTWNGKQDAISDLSDIRNGAASGASAYTAVTGLSSLTIELSAATVDHISDSDKHLPSVTSTDNGKVLAVVNAEWGPKMPITVYGGTSEPESELGNNGDIYLQSNPVVIYETDGTTGLLGHNNSTLSGNWQLENLDLTPYKEIRCYFAASKGLADTASTPAVVVTVPLDTAASGDSAYLGGAMTCLPFNRNRQYMVSCAVDSTKTKFQVIHQNTLWDITNSDANNNGRYCYKIEAYV